MSNKIVEQLPDTPYLASVYQRHSDKRLRRYLTLRLDILMSTPRSEASVSVMFFQGFHPGEVFLWLRGMAAGEPVLLRCCLTRRTCNDGSPGNPLTSSGKPH